MGENDLKRCAFKLLNKFFDDNPELLEELMETEGSRGQVKSYLRKCRLCSWVGRTQKELDMHKIIHTEVDRNIQCTLCDEMFSDMRTLMTHEKIHHKEKFQCVYCDKDFRKAIYLEKHIAVHNQALGEGEEQNPEDIEDVPIHMETLTTPYKKKYPCKHCKRNFTYKKSLKKHVRVHM